jgi:hypothetical protein
MSKGIYHARHRTRHGRRHQVDHAGTPERGLLAAAARRELTRTEFMAALQDATTAAEPRAMKR